MGVSNSLDKVLAFAKNDRVLYVSKDLAIVLPRCPKTTATQPGFHNTGAGDIHRIEHLKDLFASPRDFITVRRNWSAR